MSDYPMPTDQSRRAAADLARVAEKMHTVLGHLASAARIASRAMTPEAAERADDDVSAEMNCLGLLETEFAKAMEVYSGGEDFAAFEKSGEKLAASLPRTAASDVAEDR